jgi:hypothetical protein
LSVAVFGIVALYVAGVLSRSVTVEAGVVLAIPAVVFVAIVIAVKTGITKRVSAALRRSSQEVAD